MNHNKTEIKYGISPHNLSMVFYTTGEHDNSIVSFNDKVNALLNTNSDLTEINGFINKLESYRFNNQNPVIKLKVEPLLHAFQVTVKKQKVEK